MDAARIFAKRRRLPEGSPNSFLMNDAFRTRTDCRICGSTDLAKVLDLGSTPPANAYLRAEQLDQPERTFPLELHFCRTCSLAQLIHVVAPEILFHDYHYVTGASTPSVEHFRRYAAETIAPLITNTHDLVVDIGGNDGVLLEAVRDFARVLNVDPASNLAGLSEARGVPFMARFFSERVACEIVLEHGAAAVVTANNVFAHTDVLLDAFNGVRVLIGETGTFVCEVHWVGDLLERNCFDQIYHEHLCFYSLHAMNWLMKRAGLTLVDVEIVPTQGQSLRVFAKREGVPSIAVKNLLALEVAKGVTGEAEFVAFAARVSANRDAVLSLVKDLKASGKRIAGYGAPAKGNTLLNYYGLGPSEIEYLVDSTPQKQGLYSPGMHIPIVDRQMLESDPVDYAIILAWNFRDAILSKEASVRKAGTKFIVTVPSVEIF